MKQISYPKIKSFDNFFKDFKQKREFQGLDENNEPIFKVMPLPTLNVVGTVKLHGTNAAVCFKGDEYWTQKRTSPYRAGTIDGHFGFNAFIDQNISDLKFWLNDIYAGQLDPDITYSIYGEWCGPGVQKKVAISQLEQKMFFVFGIKMTPANDELPAFWLEPEAWKSDTIGNNRMHNIYTFPTYEYELNMNKPLEGKEYFENIVAQVEERCPVSAYFGIEGLGEGIVWGCFITDTNGNRIRVNFKTKGEKHQKASKGTKRKKEIELSPEKLTNINTFVESVDVINRLDQAIHTLYENVVPGKGETGPVIGWISKDVYDEEKNLLKELNLDWDEVKSRIGTKAREAFFDLIQKDIYGT